MIARVVDKPIETALDDGSIRVRSLAAVGVSCRCRFQVLQSRISILLDVGFRLGPRLIACASTNAGWWQLPQHTTSGIASNINLHDLQAWRAILKGRKDCLIAKMAPIAPEIELGLRLFAAQYFQVVETQNLPFPSNDILIKPEVQQWIYQNMFNETSVWPIPPVGYRSRVLKNLFSLIENSITDPEHDVRIINPSDAIVFCETVLC